MRVVYKCLSTAPCFMTSIRYEGFAERAPDLRDVRVRRRAFMLLATLYSSHSRPEQLLLVLDALIYCVLATFVAFIGGDDVFADTIIFLLICFAGNVGRHILARGAACKYVGCCVAGQQSMRPRRIY